LVKSGVPYNVAFELDDASRTAYIVILGSLDGLQFDWKRLRWRDEL
jgi:hypothetical protein